MVAVHMKAILFVVTCVTATSVAISPKHAKGDRVADKHPHRGQRNHRLPGASLHRKEPRRVVHNKQKKKTPAHKRTKFIEEKGDEKDFPFEHIMNRIREQVQKNHQRDAEQGGDDLSTAPLIPEGNRPHLRYMPEHNLIVCACAKCGSSSMYEFIFKHEFGKTWPFTGQPFVQTVISPRWEGRFNTISRNRETQVFKKAWSFALIRDPIERLVSAWMSKVACDEDRTGVDKRDRRRMLPELWRLAGKDALGSCMSLDEFAETLQIIHNNGLAHKLNAHFRPQDSVCFSKFHSSKWSKVATIRDKPAFAQLARHLGSSGNEVVVPRAHVSLRSMAKPYPISNSTVDKLHAVTANEYKMLAPHLSRET